jgi:nicotinamide-nucleotide amidase
LNTTKTELITIGNEILSGNTVNTNASWIAAQLNLIGIRVRWITVISDDHHEIMTALKTAISRADLVISTGGLGPTPDDITKNALCEFFDSRLFLDNATLAHIKKLFEGRKLTMPATNQQQAMVPDKATVIENRYGTAPGLRIEHQGVRFYFLPGVPYEMRNLISEQIIPEIRHDYDPVKPAALLFRTTGLAESRLHELVTPELREFNDITVAFLPKSSGVDLRITFADNDEEYIAQLHRRISDRLGIHIYTGEEKLLEEVVAELLKEKQMTLGVAESFTGGLIADLFTDIPGSSHFFLGSAVTYGNSAKSQILSVNPETIKTHGAVSEETVREMVYGAQKLFSSDCAIAATGIAGPTGATSEKPVGLCYLAAVRSDRIETKRFVFGKDRRINKERGAYAGIELLRRLLL